MKTSIVLESGPNIGRSVLFRTAGCPSVSIVLTKGSLGGFPLSMGADLSYSIQDPFLITAKLIVFQIYYVSQEGREKQPLSN
jgi:hypothetical protein